MAGRIARNLLVLAFAVGALASAHADSLEALQGAWAMEGTDCAAIFRREGSEIRFKYPGSSLDTGIIVTGSKIVGPSATCTTLKVHAEGDHYSVIMNCADAVLSSTVSMSFRLIDSSHFDRIDPSLSDFSLSYVKCSL